MNDPRKPLVFECTCGAMRLEIRAELRATGIKQFMEWATGLMIAGMNLVCGCKDVKDSSQ